jgi:hypothetical protein
LNFSGAGGGGGGGALLIAATGTITVTGSKEYVRFYERDTPKDEWRAITIDLAKA